MFQLLAGISSESESLVKGLHMERRREELQWVGWVGGLQTTKPPSLALISFAFFASCISHASMRQRRRQQDRPALLYVLPYAAESGAASGVMCLLTSAWFTPATPHPRNTHTHTHARTGHNERLLLNFKVRQSSRGLSAGSNI